MEDFELEVLTKEQIKEDLEEVQGQRGTLLPTSLYIILAFAGLLLIIAYSVSPMFSMIGICVVLYTGVAVYFLSKRKKNVVTDQDLKDLVYDTDVCIRIEKREDPESDVEYKYLVFAKGGRALEGWQSYKGLPRSASLREEFIVVSLKRDPKVCKYYSKEEWKLEE